MRPPYSPLLLLPSLSSTETLGTITIHSLHRSCNPSGSSCTYALTLDAKYTASSAPSTNNLDTVTTCSFIVSSSPPANLPANQTSFTAQQCGSGARFRINGAWDPESRFITLVPTDTWHGAYASLGYLGEELVEGRTVGPREGVAYRLGMASDEKEKRGEAEKKMVMMMMGGGDGDGDHGDGDDGHDDGGKGDCEKGGDSGKGDCGKGGDGGKGDGDKGDGVKGDGGKGDDGYGDGGKDGDCGKGGHGGKGDCGKGDDGHGDGGKGGDCGKDGGKGDCGKGGDGGKGDDGKGGYGVKVGDGHEMGDWGKRGHGNHDGKRGWDDNGYNVMIRGLRKSGWNRSNGRKENKIMHGREKRGIKRDAMTLSLETTRQVRGLTMFTDIQLEATAVRFTLADSERGEKHCSFAVPSIKTSWYAQRCGNEFTISWGYNKDTDSAVMTICRPLDGTAAWFGFDEVSSSDGYLGDSKAEPVHRTGCA
ncbi:hypothetical protein MFIFM68171_04291 [Madurella fahalii]|uniref:Uncharacterized protein n=1 Tax=Madurella fahalii TaxID=1157608 RepID=A0ABQ0G8M7_9PEZI